MGTDTRKKDAEIVVKINSIFFFQNSKVETVFLTIGPIHPKKKNIQSLKLLKSIQDWNFFEKDYFYTIWCSVSSSIISKLDISICNIIFKTWKNRVLTCKKWT